MSPDFCVQKRELLDVTPSGGTDGETNGTLPDRESRVASEEVWPYCHLRSRCEYLARTGSWDDACANCASGHLHRLLRSNNPRGGTEEASDLGCAPCAASHGLVQPV
jgi:hypothetical protein